jgi:DNA (cytosine-5)-methyltransferase 1
LPKAPEKTLADETDLIVRNILEQGIDGVIGGFPCQDVSVSGKKAGLLRDAAGDATTRSGLFWEMVRTVCVVRPKIWLMENVAELLDGHLGTVLEAVAGCGYDAEWDCVAASTVGAPHHRGRIYVLAYPSGTRGSRNFPEALPRQPEFQRYENCRGVEDVIRMSDISEPIIRRAVNGVAKRLHAIGNGNPPCVIRELTRGLK